MNTSIAPRIAPVYSLRHVAHDLYRLIVPARGIRRA